MKRAIIIVLDSVGIENYLMLQNMVTKEVTHFVNIKKAMPDMDLKNMCELGLANIEGKDIYLLGKVENPKGCFAKMAEKSIGKDTTTGHWEMAGVITKTPSLRLQKVVFPKNSLKHLKKQIGTKY